MFQAGAAPFMDVLDLHTYTKTDGGQAVPEGYPKGAPEALFDSMRKVDAVLKKHGQSDIRRISTEFGFSEAVSGNPAGHITPQIKAEYLVRGLILHYAMGFKRVFLYSFWDAGKDIHSAEDSYGLIDHDLQKKPSYFAVKTCINLLGDSQLVGPLPGMELPSLGYAFQNDVGDSFTTVVWDGSSERVGIFKTSAMTVKQYDIFGKLQEVTPDKEGQFQVTYGSSPVYLQADKKIDFVSSEK